MFMKNIFHWSPLLILLVCGNPNPIFAEPPPASGNTNSTQVGLTDITILAKHSKNLQIPWRYSPPKPKFSKRSQFPQPKEIKAKYGFLIADLEVKLSTNTIKDPISGEIRKIKTPTYNGGLTGPTLRVRPGDSLSLNVMNNLPDNPPDQRMGAFPHDPFTTNLHTHGLTVDPTGIADNVFRQMEPGTVSPVKIQIPPDHQAGTFWYHPHKHGSVSFQFFGGMSGLLIIEGGKGTLDDVPEVKSAKEVLMVFQAIRTDQRGRLPFVNMVAPQFSSGPENSLGLLSTYQNSFFYLTTNGKTNPVLHMKPGEVQRWRLLNAASGLSLVVALEEHELHIISNDGITVPEMVTLLKTQPTLLGAGNRADLLIKAGKPGTYVLQALDPRGPNGGGYSVIPQSGIDPAPRNARIGFDFPTPGGELEIQQTTYPYTLATIIVSGPTTDMPLPEGPLPVPQALPSIDTQLNKPPDAVRNIAFEICGQRFGQQNFDGRLPSCGWYFNLYDENYWGGAPFTSLLMMRDADDEGIENPGNPEMPTIDYQKEGLFEANTPLFPDMYAGNFEEWTIYNRSFSDHPFHIHINPFLVTHINGQELTPPEYRDTIIVPAAAMAERPNNLNINDAKPGSVTFRTFFDPSVTGAAVMHCHILTHEDLGMMQRIDITQAPDALGGLGRESLEFEEGTISQCMESPCLPKMSLATSLDQRGNVRTHKADTQPETLH